MAHKFDTKAAVQRRYPGAVCQRDPGYGYNVYLYPGSDQAIAMGHGTPKSAWDFTYDVLMHEKRL